MKVAPRLGAKMLALPEPKLNGARAQGMNGASVRPSPLYASHLPDSERTEFLPAKLRFSSPATEVHAP